MAKTLLLVDASAYIFRAFFALPAMNRPDGTPIGAVYGFTQMLMKLVADKAPDYTIVVLDKSRITFRNEIYPEYKANRTAPPDDLIPQFKLIAPAAEALNLAVAEAEGFEADDLIATYAKAARAAKGEKINVEIISSDKDLMQLIQEGVTMFDPMKQKYIGEAEVAEKFGVAPARVVDVQALAGDASDNVPGVPGIGVKTAAALIAEFGDLENLLDKAETIAQPKRRQALVEFADQARLSKRLVILRDDAPMPVALADAQQRDYDVSVLRAFLTEHNFKSLLRRLEDTGDAGAGAGDAVPKEVSQDYQLIGDANTLGAWLAQCGEAGETDLSGVLAIHTYTTPDVVHGSSPATLHGIALACAPGKSA